MIIISGNIILFQPIKNANYPKSNKNHSSFHLSFYRNLFALSFPPPARNVMPHAYTFAALRCQHTNTIFCLIKQIFFLGKCWLYFGRWLGCVRVYCVLCACDLRIFTFKIIRTRPYRGRPINFVLLP